MAVGTRAIPTSPGAIVHAGLRWLCVLLASALLGHLMNTVVVGYFAAAQAVEPRPAPARPAARPAISASGVVVAVAPDRSADNRAIPRRATP